MIRTIEAIVDKHGNVHLLEAVTLPTARRAFVIILDEPPSPLATLYGEFADEDRALAEEGMTEYGQALAIEDEVEGKTRPGEETSSPQLETGLLSENALAEDWNRPEEEEAWSYLQPVR